MHCIYWIYVMKDQLCGSKVVDSTRTDIMKYIFEGGSMMTALGTDFYEESQPRSLTTSLDICPVCPTHHSFVN